MRSKYRGVPCHLCTGFPIEGLRETAAAATKPVDREQVLEDIQLTYNPAFAICGKGFLFQRDTN